MTYSTFFFTDMNEQNQTIKQLNYDILPMYIQTLFIKSVRVIY